MIEKLLNIYLIIGLVVALREAVDIQPLPEGMDGRSTVRATLTITIHVLAIVFAWAFFVLQNEPLVVIDEEETEEFEDE